MHLVPETAVQVLVYCKCGTYCTTLSQASVLVVFQKVCHGTQALQCVLPFGWHFRFCVLCSSAIFMSTCTFRTEALKHWGGVGECYFVQSHSSRTVWLKWYLSCATLWYCKMLAVGEVVCFVWLSLSSGARKHVKKLCAILQHLFRFLLTGIHFCR